VRCADLRREEQGRKWLRPAGPVKLAETVKDKNAPLIFACNGGECWKSYKVRSGAKPGYGTCTGSGRFPEWKAKNLRWNERRIDRP